MDDTPESLPPLTFLQVMGSIAAAAIGVQKKENKVRDFTRGTVGQFIAAGIVFTVCFIAFLVSIVSYVLS